MISHAFNSASTCLHTATSSKPLRAFPKLDKPSSAPETGSSPTGVAKKQDPKLSTSNPGKGLQNSSVSKKADKITSHGSHTEKANCWYHSSRDNINTQPVELLLVHLMRPLGLAHAVPSTCSTPLPWLMVWVTCLSLQTPSLMPQVWVTLQLLPQASMVRDLVQQSQRLCLTCAPLYPQHAAQWLLKVWGYSARSKLFSQQYQDVIYLFYSHSLMRAQWNFPDTTRVQWQIILTANGMCAYIFPHTNFFLF